MGVLSFVSADHSPRVHPHLRLETAFSDYLIPTIRDRYWKA